MDNETRALVEQVAEAAATKAVERTMIQLGVSLEHPLDMQKDMAYLRTLREASYNVRTKGTLTILGLFITGLAAAVWTGLQSFFRGS